MIMTILARLGRDPETLTTKSGTAVVNLALAYNYGRKDDDGKRPSQWIDASFFGERAEKVAQYLAKGSQIVAHLDDVHVHLYEKKDGTTGSALRARVVDIEFAGSKTDAAPAPAPTPKAAPARRSAPPASVADMDNDIPF